MNRITTGTIVVTGVILSINRITTGTIVVTGVILSIMTTWIVPILNGVIGCGIIHALYDAH